MKLVCVVVLTLGTVVTASPYGYGVKGGALAAAKSDSSAAATSIPGIAVVPLSIPSGGSYSGSFSKSSSSSFASSSASSSSGSFTYNGSGTVPSGYSINGISGSTKCSSGNCPTGNYGTSVVGTDDIGYTGAYSGANAAAGAGAIVFPGSYEHNAECSGGACKPVCEGDSCGANTNTVTTNTDKKCSSADCNVPTPTSSSTSAEHVSNDIYVSTPGSKISSPSNKPFTASTSACTYGNCRPTAPTETKLSYQSSSDTHPSTTVPVSKPSPSLVAPKEDKPCTLPSCGSSSYNKEKPSSYNVPVYSQSITPCDSGNCGNSEPHLSALPAAPSTSTTAVCAGGNCGNSIQPTPGFLTQAASNSASDYPDFVPLAPSPVKPSYTQSVPTHAPLGTTGAAPTGAYSKPGNFGSPKPLASVAATSEAKIPYTGGFGGPPGFLKPNEFTAPSGVSSTNYKPVLPTGLHNNPPAPTGPATPIHLPSCISGNCGPIPPSYKPAAPTTSYPTPGQSTSTNYQSGLPSSTQYKPTKPTDESCVFGNCGIQSSQSPSSQLENSGSYKPSGSYSPNGGTASPSPVFCTSGNCGGQPQPSPSTPTASYSPTGCSSGNCGSQPHYSAPQFGQSGSYKPSFPAESYKPMNPTGTNKPPFCTSGDCGTKPGSLFPHYEPNGSYGPPGAESSYNPTASSVLYNPLCSSGNCGTQPGQSIPQFGQNPYKPLPPTGAYNPSASYNPNGCISGNCGAPSQSPSQFGQSGSYKPTGPTGSYTPTGTSTGSFGQTGCESGACESPIVTLPQHAPSGSSYNPSITTGTPGILICPTGNCGLYPIQQIPTSTYNHGLNNPSGCSSGNCQPIASGSQFNRPSTGSYTPSGPSESNNSGCSSGNCAGSLAKPATPVFGAPAGVLKPNEFSPILSPPTGSYKPVLASGQPSFSSTAPNPFCTSGKCVAQPGLITESHAIAGAAASANKILYTGGFGGPPGLLQPYDGGKVSIEPHASGSHITGNFGLSQGTGVHSSYGKSLNYASAPGAVGNAQASAIAGAAASNYGGSESGGDDHHGTGGCKGGCGGNTGLPNVGAAAKSYSAGAAKAAAGAYSGSYASSSASARSYAGAATKGGYGKR